MKWRDFCLPPPRFLVLINQLSNTQICLNKQFRSAVNVVHWTKKCNSVSGGASVVAGEAAGGASGASV